MGGIEGTELAEQGVTFLVAVAIEVERGVRPPVDGLARRFKPSAHKMAVSDDLLAVVLDTARK